MGNRGRFIIRLMIAFIALLPCLTIAQPVHVRLALFRGKWMEPPGQPPAVRFLSAFTNPEFSTLKSKIAAPQKELRAAVVEVLAEHGDLKEIDDLFVMDRPWDVKMPGITDSVVGRESAYRVGMLLKGQASGTFRVHVAVKQTREGVFGKPADGRAALRQAFEATLDDSKLEDVIDRELLVTIDDPVIVVFPWRQAVDFLLIALTRKPIEIEPPEPRATGNAELVPAPRAIREVPPLYPDELKKEGIGGELKLRAVIGKDGKVAGIFVTKSVHPYLDFTGVEAFKGWEFEPIVKRGKPVRAAFDYSYFFDPSSTAPGESARPAPSAVYSGELDRILAGCAAYCRKVRSAALDFVCEEKTYEVRHSLNPNMRPEDLWYTWSGVIAESAGGAQLAVETSVQVMDPDLTETETYLCDYQLVRKGEAIKEQRIILKKNGRAKPDRTELLEDKRFSMIVPMTIGPRILGGDRQPLYDFQIGRQSRISGRETSVLEAVSRPGNGEWIRKARIWVDRESFQIIKSEIEGVPIEGYEDVLRDCARLNGRPDFQMTNEYGIEKNGVMFPEKTTVQVSYEDVGRLRPISKLRMSLKYAKYKFFTVETDHEIIK